jgi:tagatose-1,6-bisphosphate aldolase
MISRKLQQKIAFNYAERQITQDIVDTKELGAAAVNLLVFYTVDSPRPDRQDFLQLSIEAFPPKTQE